MDLLDIDETKLSKLRPSAFTPGRAMPQIDQIVQESLTEDFPRIRKLLPETYFLDRCGSAIFYRMPWLLHAGRDLSRLNVLELGCGRGLKAIPWSRLFHSYLGVDLDPAAVSFAREAARETGRQNLEFHVGNAVEAVRHSQRFGIAGQIDVIVLYAVLEHMLPAERKQVLGLCREILQEDGIVVLCETPNRLIPHDGHSTFLHFFQTLPPQIALEYVKHSQRPGAAEAVAAGEEALYRYGQGVSYHEFELWMADESKKLPGITSDAWAHWSLFDEPPRRDEVWLNEYLQANGPLAPPAFARFWIEAIFDGSVPPATTPAVPKRIAPALLPNMTHHSDRRFFTLDTVVCRFPEELHFSAGGAKTATLLLDLNQSAGQIALKNNERIATVLEVEGLRSARLPKWHQACAIDLSAFAPLDAVSIAAASTRSVVVSPGLIIR